MSICFFFSSALSLDQTRTRIAEARSKYGELLDYFWISQGREADAFTLEDDAELGFQTKSVFLIQWNKERSELIPMIPPIFYEVFGRDNILIRDNNYDIVPPR